MNQRIVVALTCALSIAVLIQKVNAEPLSLGASSNIDISFSASFVAGASSVGDGQIQQLQSGGHDPKRNGMNVQNLELTLSGPVDPFFDGMSNIVMLVDDEGESIFEVEEAYLTTRRLPFDLQLKLGQYNTEFGRHNTLHPHSWAFVDQPVVVSRVLGSEGLRSQGARLSWLAPTPWYVELIGGVQNAKGSTSESFLGGHHAHEGETDEESERAINGLDDLLYSGRILNGIDFSDNLSGNLGYSLLYGPNNSGPEAQSLVQGFDIYLRWQPDVSVRGYPFISWHSEFLIHQIRTEAEHHHGSDEHSEEDNDKNWGWFSQLRYGFSPGWVAGLRLEYATSNSHEKTFENDQRNRIAMNLSWYPSEYSKIRLQYNHDQADHLAETAHSIWLQFEYNLGAHAAHVF